MSQIEKFKKEHEIGFPIFNQIFSQPVSEIKKLVEDIVNDSQMSSFFKSCSVTKTSVDDVPREIQMNFYDSIEITPLGITHYPEHGVGTTIVKFDKYFKLPNNAAFTVKK